MRGDYLKLDQPEVLALLFHPRRESGSPPNGAVDLDVPVGGDAILGVRFYKAAVDGAVILFFHGNGELAADYDYHGREYNKLGLNLLAVDYRGYGRSTGTPTASNMLSDAREVFAWAKTWLGAEGYHGPLIIMGRSLGSAAALEIVTLEDNAVAGLFIDSGFAYTVPLLQGLGVDTETLGITEEDGFGNYFKISKFSKPTYILHAQHDTIISLVDAETLQAQSGARFKEFSMVPGADHNNIIDRVGDMYFQAVKRFANKLGRPQRSPKPGVRGA